MSIDFWPSVPKFYPLTFPYLQRLLNFLRLHGAPALDLAWTARLGMSCFCMGRGEMRCVSVNRSTGGGFGPGIDKLWFCVIS